ncbi:MAG TPA: hypothetical protein VIT22_05595 [Pseudoxanthomonas sp.]
MNSPPPLPTPASAFVTVMAYLSLALGALGVVSGAWQAVMLAAMPPGETMREQFMAGGIALPPALLQMFDHLGLLNLLSLLFSAAFTVASWGLLKRREWGRLGFIACLVVGAILGFAMMFWMMQLMALMNTLAGADLADADPMFRSMQSAMKIMMAVAAALVAVLHGAIIWKLCTPAIRAEFRS